MSPTQLPHVSEASHAVELFRHLTGIQSEVSPTTQVQERLEDGSGAIPLETPERLELMVAGSALPVPTVLLTGGIAPMQTLAPRRISVDREQGYVDLVDWSER